MNGSLALRLVLAVLLGGPFALSTAGCQSGQKTRATVKFRAGGVRINLDRLKREVGRKDQFGMRAAYLGVLKALDGLPEQVAKQAKTRVEQRKASAQSALDAFRKLVPELESLKYEKADMLAKIARIEQLLDDVEKD